MNKNGVIYYTHYTMKQYTTAPPQQYAKPTQQTAQEEHDELEEQYLEQLDDFIKENNTWIQADLTDLTRNMGEINNPKHIEITDNIIEYYIENNGNLNLEYIKTTTSISDTTTLTSIATTFPSPLLITPNELLTPNYPQTYSQSISLYNQLQNKPSIALPPFMSTLRDVSIRYLPAGAGILSAVCLFPHIETLKNFIPILQNLDSVTISMKLFVIIQDITSFVRNVSVNRQNLKKEWKKLGRNIVDISAQYVGYAAVPYATLAIASSPIFIPIGGMALSFFISTAASNIFSIGVKAILHINEDKIELMEEKNKQEQEMKEKRDKAILNSLRQGKSIEVAEKEYEDEKQRIFTKDAAKKIIVSMTFAAISGVLVNQLMSYMVNMGTIGNVINYLSTNAIKSTINSFLLKTIMKYAQIDQIVNKVIDKTFDRKKQRLPNFCHKYMKKTRLTKWLTNITMNELIKTVLNGYIQQNVSKYGLENIAQLTNIDNIYQITTIISEIDINQVNSTLINIPSNVLQNLNDYNLNKAYNYIDEYVHNSYNKLMETSTNITNITDLFRIDFGKYGEKFNDYMSSMFVTEYVSTTPQSNIVHDTQPFIETIGEIQQQPTRIEIGQIQQQLLPTEQFFTTIDTQPMTYIEPVSSKLPAFEQPITAIDTQQTIQPFIEENKPIIPEQATTNIAAIFEQPAPELPIYGPQPFQQPTTNIAAIFEQPITMVDEEMQPITTTQPQLQQLPIIEEELPIYGPEPYQHPITQKDQLIQQPITIVDEEMQPIQPLQEIYSEININNMKTTTAIQRQIVENNIDKISNSIVDINDQIDTINNKIEYYEKIKKIEHTQSIEPNTNEILTNNINILQRKKRILIGTRSQYNMLLSNETNRLDKLHNIQQTLLQEDEQVLLQQQHHTQLLSSIEDIFQSNNEINKHINTEIVSLNFLAAQTSAEIIMIDNELSMDKNIQDITNNFQYILQNQGINELINNQSFLKNDLQLTNEEIQTLQTLSLKQLEKQSFATPQTIVKQSEKEIETYNKFIRKIKQKTTFTNEETGEEVNMTTCLINKHNSSCLRNSLLKNSLEMVLKTYFYKEYAYLKIADKTIETIASISSVKLLTSDDLITIMSDSGVDILSKFTSPTQAAEFISNIQNFGRYNVADVQLELLTNPENFSLIMQFINGTISNWDFITKLPKIVPTKMLTGF